MANAPEIRALSVSALTAQLKQTLEQGFPRVYVEGEITGWKRYPSGHAYFTLKDAEAQISAVMFSSAFESCCNKHPGIERQLKDGAQVVVGGKVSVYGPRGNYQLVVLGAKIAGAGELMQRFLELKAKLEGEGLFDRARKRALPFLPRRIGIVTSEAGAVIHDMCTVLTRRFPSLEIRLFPCLVQGTEAPRTICAGIAYFQSEWMPDLLIVARGGGSFEDLFCFNDEALVRAVAASKIPTMSAVGHETDYTLCDFAADVRAGTPSIAAEIAVPVLEDLRRRLAQAQAQMTAGLRAKGDFFAQRVDQLSATMTTALRAKGEQHVQRVEQLGTALGSALKLALVRVESRLEKAEAKLVAYSPYGVLDRGYSLTTAADGTVVRDAATLKSGDRIVTRFAQGSTESTVM